MKNICEKYAKLLVGYSLGLKKGDKFLIRSSYLAEDLVKEVYREALAAGALPELKIDLAEMGEKIIKVGKRRFLKIIVS